MQTDRKEALRYLGLGKHEPDPETERLLEECIREAERAAEFRHLVREYPLSVEEDGTVDGGCFRVKSANLKKNLSGCDSVLVMAVTVGAEVDRLLARYGKLSVAKAVVMQAAAAAMVEAYCNELNASINSTSSGESSARMRTSRESPSSEIFRSTWRLTVRTSGPIRSYSFWMRRT